MKQAERPGIKKQREIRDQIAQAQGYKDHADAMAHLKPYRVRKDAITMSQIYEKLDEYQKRLNCIRSVLTMNYACVFLGSPCDATCKHYESCQKMIQPLDREYRRFLKGEPKMQVITVDESGMHNKGLQTPGELHQTLQKALGES